MRETKKQRDLETGLPGIVIINAAVETKPLLNNSEKLPHGQFWNLIEYKKYYKTIKNHRLLFLQPHQSTVPLNIINRQFPSIDTEKPCEIHIKLHLWAPSN
jgi:hypothetical protein